MTDNWLLARPEVDLDEVRALARREYGVDGELTELGSQQDRNFLVRGVDGAGMLVKIFHPTVDAFAVDLHIAASDRLRSEGLLTPEVLTTAGGARTTQIVCADGQVARVAGFQIVDGQPLSDITDADGAQAEELVSSSPRSPTFWPEWMPRTPTATCSGSSATPSPSSSSSSTTCPRTVASSA
jgi:Ser/Thr protein kinase RdoA (MazF antagonist)